MGNPATEQVALGPIINAKQVERVRMVVLTKVRPEFLTLFEPVKIRYSDASDRNRSGPSFPSGHVTNNATVALILTFFFRRWGWLYALGRPDIWKRIARWPRADRMLTCAILCISER